MPAYVLAEISITDPQGYDAYGAGARVATERFGGKIIARATEATVLEGLAFVFTCV
jgi:uncharacterized protein (DUF1330 family)